ncbi:hypothetical protein TNCV_3281401 [Trichonephila clavipes]|nr:hypothetical protein TNCV_3281401 [Trichonephila clavipes]
MSSLFMLALSLHGKRLGGLCVHPKRYQPKHRHCLIHIYVFWECYVRKQVSRFSPNGNMPTIAVEAEPGLRYKKKLSTDHASTGNADAGFHKLWGEPA